MKNPTPGVQTPPTDNQRTMALENSGSTDSGSDTGDLKQRIQTLAQELEKSTGTIDALTAELTARDRQLSSIVNSRAWRWVNRYSCVKRGYVVPAYEFLRGLFGKGRKKRDGASMNLEPLRSAASQLLADVVCFSNMDWDFRYQRPQQIMSQFAQHGHRVFYIRLDRVLSGSPPRRFSLVQVKENLFQVTLAAQREVWINREDIRGTNAESLLHSLDELGRMYHIKDAIGYVMSPAWTSLALEAKSRWGWQLIYDCMDEWNGFPRVGRAISRAEQRLARKCDLLVVSGQRLYDKWRDLDRPMALTRNAVDYDFYVEGCQPNTLLRKVDHPIVGYYGALADWFDVELMVHLARKRPAYTFVLLGQVVGADISQLESLPNVRLLGQQPYQTMPQYLYHFDACLIPFKITRTTEATDPVKVYEYLSSGKPVVSVDLPELESFKDLLYIGRDRDHFLDQLDKALVENDPELAARRRAFAAANTWKERYQTIVAELRNAMTR